MYPNMTVNDTGIYGIMNYANVITSGWLGILLLVGIFFMLFAVLKRYETYKALPTSAFITSILGIFLRTTGLVNDYILVSCIIITVFASLWLFWSD